MQRYIVQKSLLKSEELEAIKRDHDIIRESDQDLVFESNAAERLLLVHLFSAIGCNSDH